MAVKRYAAVVNGYETILKLTPKEAEEQGLKEYKPTTTTAAKSATPANKSRTPSNKRRTTARKAPAKAPEKAPEQSAPADNG